MAKDLKEAQDILEKLKASYVKPEAEEDDAEEPEAEEEDQDEEEPEQEETPEVEETPEQEPAKAAQEITPKEQLLNEFKALQTKRQAALTQAQQQANINTLMSNLGKAGSLIGSGLATTGKAGGIVHPTDVSASQDFYKDLEKQNLEQLRQNVGNVQEAKEADLEDPTSPYSKSLQKVLTDRLGLKEDSVKSLSANTLMRLFPTLTSISQTELKSEATKEAARTKAEAAAKSLALKLQEHKQETLEKAQTKKETEQEKAYAKLRKDLETFRGNQAAQLAARNQLSAANALRLVEGKDLNKLTSQDLTLFADELAKIATGGVPGEHGVKALMPSNLSTKIAEFKNFLLSKPTPTQAGEYVKRNIAYLKDLQNVSQDTLNDYRKNIIHGAKKSIRPEDLEEVMSDYGLGEKPKTIKEHPMDEEAVAWAKANPQDPRAAAILRANGL